MKGVGLTVLITIILCAIWAGAMKINDNQRYITLPVVETINVSNMPYLDIKDESGDSEDKRITVDTIYHGIFSETWTPGSPPVKIIIKAF